MPYKSIQQMRFMHAQHPDIAARWDQEIREKKKKGRYKKPPRGPIGKAHMPKPDSGWLKPLGIGVAGGAVANQFPSIGSMVAESKKEKRRAKRAQIKKADYSSNVHSDDPDFNHDAARKIYDLVMKMDTDTAEMFVHIVASDIFESDVERNLATYQKHLNQVLAKRQGEISKALARLALSGDDRALAYAEAMEQVSKADPPHTPQYYGYQWRESDFRRDPQTGRFMVKVHHTMSKPLDKDHAKSVIGSSGHEKDLGISDDKLRAQYQDEYRQVASFLEMAHQAHGGPGNTDVVYHLADDAGHRFQHVDNSGRPNKQVLAESGTRLEALEAKPTTLTHGGAAFGLATALGGTMTPEQMSRVTGAEQANRDFTRAWVESGDNEISNMQTYQRLAAAGALAGKVGAPGGKVQLAGKLAEVVGSYGPQAEQVIGPSARKTAYRYRGTEKAPDPKLVRVYAQEIQDAKKYGFIKPTPEMEQKIADELGQRRYYGRTETGRTATQTRARISPGVAPSIYQMAQQRAGDAALAAREPDWNERTVGSMVVGEYLKLKIPQKGLYGLHLHAGNTPPSEGVIIDSEGRLAAQASGYGDDHYLPFNLKNLKALKGGEYIRNRSVGGLTSEDVYTGLMAGARRVTVVSRSGTFTMEFEPDFRGGRRHNDKALRMTRRYEQLLDAVQSGQVERKEIPLKWRKQIEKEVADDMPGATKVQIRDEIKERIKEFKEDPEIDLRDRDRAEALIDDMDARAKRGEVKNYDAKQYRAQIMNELRDMKEVRFRLNGLGYEAALKSLQEQFPYYIHDVRTTTNRDEELKEFEEDKGYVEPGRNRPTKARAGLYGTEENKGYKFSASQADYQRGRAGGQYKAAVGQKAAELPKEGTEGTASTTGGSEARQSEREKKAADLADAMQAAGKNTKMRAANAHLWKTITQNYPRENWEGEAPDWYDLEDEKAFRSYMENADNQKRFYADIAANRKKWSGPVPGAREALMGWDKARGAISQVAHTKALSRIFPPDAPYNFPKETKAAYHANAKDSDVRHELSELDKEPLLTTSKKFSDLDDQGLEAELDKTNELWDLTKQGFSTEDVLTSWHNTAPDGSDVPSVTRMKPVLKDENAMYAHLEKLHKVRYLKDQQANLPRQRPAPNVGGNQGGGAAGGGGGGQPAQGGGGAQRGIPGPQHNMEESDDYQALDPVHKKTADSYREAYLSELKGARQNLAADLQDLSTQKQAKKLKPKIDWAFDQLHRKRTTTEEVDAVMEQLSDEERHYVHNTSNL